MVNIAKFKKMRIEINSDCNRKCVFCPRGDDKTRWINGGQDGKKQQLINQQMKTEDVISLLDQNAEFFGAQVGFDFYNEATMDDRLLYFCEYTKNLGQHVEIVTNGDYMINDKNYTLELFRLSDSVNISLYDYKDYDGREKLMNKWRNYLLSIGIAPNRYRLVGDYFSFGNRAGLIDRRNKFMEKAHLDKDVPIKADCKKIHSKLNVRYDGDVPICCEDSHVRFSLGNVLETSIMDVWYGDRMKLATMLLQSGDRAAIDPCSKCVKGIKPVKI